MTGSPLEVSSLHRRTESRAPKHAAALKPQINYFTNCYRHFIRHQVGLVMKIHCAQLSTNTLYSTEMVKCAALTCTSLFNVFYSISSSRTHLMCKYPLEHLRYLRLSCRHLLQHKSSQIIFSSPKRDTSPAGPSSTPMTSVFICTRLCFQFVTVICSSNRSKHTTWQCTRRTWVCICQLNNKS